MLGRKNKVKFFPRCIEIGIWGRRMGLEPPMLAYAVIVPVIVKA